MAKYTSINNVYDKFWSPYWTNPTETYQRVYEQDTFVEVHIGRHQIRVPKTELIEFDRTKYSVHFISKNKYGNLFHDENWNKINYNLIKEIKLEYDDSDERYVVTLITKDNERMSYVCSCHCFWGCSDVDFVRNISSIIPVKEYWTDGARYQYIKTL